MYHDEIAQMLLANGTIKDAGLVIVQDHVPKVREFFEKDCWSHHPQPYADFMEWRKVEDKWIEEEATRTIPSF